MSQESPVLVRICHTRRLAGLHRRSLKRCAAALNKSIDSSSSSTLACAHGSCSGSSCEAAVSCRTIQFKLCRLNCPEPPRSENTKSIAISRTCMAWRTKPAASNDLRRRSFSQSAIGEDRRPTSHPTTTETIVPRLSQFTLLPRVERRPACPRSRRPVPPARAIGTAASCAALRLVSTNSAAQDVAYRPGP
jgi:hypothetical protein